MQNFSNPLAFNSVSGSGGLLDAILTIIIVISTPIVVFFLIYAGFLYVIARGNPEQIADARRALLYGVIGGVVILGSFAITAMVGGIVTSFSP